MVPALRTRVQLQAFRLELRARLATAFADRAYSVPTRRTGGMLPAPIAGQRIYVMSRNRERDCACQLVHLPGAAQKKLHPHHRDDVWTKLWQRGIEAGRYFAPSHLQPSLSNVPFRCGDLTHTMSISERLLCLPLLPALTETQMAFVCETLDQILRNCAMSRDEPQAAVS